MLDAVSARMDAEQATPVRPALLGAVLLSMVALYATLLLPQDAVNWLTKEDGPFEYVGALGLLVTCVLFLLGYRHLRRADPEGVTGVWRRRSLVVLALVFLFGAGEEISWGQRLLGIATPEGLAGNNVQGEINVHNLAPVTGQSYQLFLAGWYTFILLIPLLAALHEPSRARLRRLVPIVPLWIGLLFFANYVLAQVSLFAAPVMSEVRAQTLEAAERAVGPSLAGLVTAVYPLNRAPLAEVQELVVALLAVLTAWVVLKRLRRGPSDRSLRGAAGPGGRRPAPRRQPAS
jgi:hypothetical protein